MTRRQWEKVKTKRKMVRELGRKTEQETDKEAKHGQARQRQTKLLPRRQTRAEKDRKKTETDGAREHKKERQRAQRAQRERNRHTK